MWISLAVALAALAVALVRRRRAPLPLLTCGAAAVSLAVTALGAQAGTDPSGLVESAALLGLIAMTARWSPVRQAIPACLLAGVAASAWLLRYLPDASPLEQLGATAFWSLGAFGAAAVAAYLRSLETGRLRAVADGRAQQRLRLARDLHDYVAHDVSEMVAQAQAGQLVTDPEQRLLILRRVEEAGLRAMETLDRTVLELHAPGLSGLPALVERFSSSGTAQASLSLSEEPVPEEVGAQAYRVVVEALTNIRRHAPAATRVHVTIGRVGPSLHVTVTDDGVPVTDTPRVGGGSGLPALRAQVAELGGELVARAVPDGWSVEAHLPLPQPGRRGRRPPLAR